MSKRCNWLGGCSVVLSSYNKTGLCSVHEGKKPREKLFGKSETKKLHNVEVLVLTKVKEFPKQTLSVDEILRLVYVFYNISLERLLDHTRKQKVVVARHTAVYLIRIDLKKPFTKIAEILRRKDHTTVIHAFRKIEKLVSINKQLRTNIETIRSHYSNPD